MGTHPSEHDLSRRDLLSRSVPALAAGATVLTGMTALAQNTAPNANPIAPGAAPAAGAMTDGPPSAVVKMFGDAYAGQAYTLPKLPYAYGDLEPHIDAQTMELHHSKHHAAYVANLNKAIESLGKLREEADIDAAKLAGLSRDISFNAGGHIFHTVFFGIMSKPAEAMIPEIDVKRDIVKQYGSLDKFIAQFNKVAAGVKGSGWAVAFFEPLADRILITDTGDQDQRIIPGGVPILLIDVWEHAYYLKHQNKRADYIKAWWNVVNWMEVNALYKAIRGLHGKN